MSIPERAAERRTTTRPQLILVADDADDVRTLWGAYLRICDFEVIEACNGLEAVQKAMESVPSAILMDFAMPGLDGARAAQQIRAYAPLHNVPLIGLTAHGGPFVDEFLQACDVVLTKPVPPDKLLDVLRGLLRGAARA